MHWIRTEEKLPGVESKVLAYYGDPVFRYDIVFIDESGNWTATFSADRTVPSYWMPIPEPPSEEEAPQSPYGISVEVVEDRVMLDIDEEKEVVAALMQHFIKGDTAIVNGTDFFVIDMKNEMIGEKIVSVFYLRRAE